MFKYKFYLCSVVALRFFVIFISANKEFRVDYFSCKANCLEINSMNFSEGNLCRERCKFLMNQNDTEDVDLFGKNLTKFKLHCITDETISLKWKSFEENFNNNSLYFIELYNKQFGWIYTATTAYTNVTFEKLLPENEYKFRVSLIETYENKTYFLHSSKFSSWIWTLAANYTPEPVTEIQLKNMKLDGEEFQATIQWKPNYNQPSCYYELVYFSHVGTGDYQQHEFVDPSKEFEITIDQLEFDSNFSIGILAKSKDWERESPTILAYFNTPSCLEIVGNLNVCIPAQPINLETNEVFKETIIDELSGHATSFYDIFITWDSPLFTPDYYLISIHVLNANMTIKFRLNMTVTGNETVAIFHNVDVGPRYFAYLIAHSNAGDSEPAIVHRQMAHQRIPVKSKQIWVVTIISLIVVLVFIVIVVSFYIYHRRAKKKRYERRYQYFKDLEEKAPKTFDCITSETGLINENSIHVQQIRDDKWEIKSDKLVLQSVLGEGEFGLVRRAWLWDEKNANSKEVAVKMLKDSPSSEQTRQFMHEIEIMKTVGPHPQLVSLIGCCARSIPGRGVNMMLVVEFCSLGDLQNYLRNIWDQITAPPDHKNLNMDDNTNSNLIINKLYDYDSNVCVNLKPNDLLSFGRQIAVGMEFLASMKVLHRDLAARNVLVCADKRVKIADFGLSRDVYKENMYKKSGNGRLPIRWLALESLTHQIYTTQSDVWSFGILLWEIVTLGGNPYPTIPTNALVKYLRSGYRMERPSNCGPELYSIMLSCWKVRPKDRPSFTELRKRLDELLECLTTSEYLDLNVGQSNEMASLRSSVKDYSSFTPKSKARNSDRYVHPVMLNNAKNSSNNTNSADVLIK